jgi:hypothetical protein
MSEPNSKWYLQARDGSEKGPYATDAVLSSLADGSISAKTLLRSNLSGGGTSTWKVAAEHSELAGHLGIRGPAPAAAPSITEIVTASGSCSVCGGALATKPKKTLLGFRKFACQRCPNFELFPLSTTYMIIYCLVLCWAAFSVLSPLFLFSPKATQAGADVVAYQLGRVSMFALPSMIALLKNYQVRRQRR